jgi:hypothetical protein
MTPTLFHQSAALWLVAVVIARRVKINLGFGDIYPNIFVMWLAPTTLYRKSTALDVARITAYKTMSHLLLPQDTTPEALLAELAGQAPKFLDDLPKADKEDFYSGRDYAGQKGLILDEASGLLASAGRDYNQGLLESFLRFYDCDARYRRRTVGHGVVTVRNSYLSFLCASTPMAMAQHLGEPRLWLNGWWARFAILTPEHGRPAWKRPIEMEEPAELGRGLRTLLGRLPWSRWPEPPTALSVGIDKGAFDVWWRYNKAVSHTLLDDDLDRRLYGSYGRLPSLALKIAMILAALDWSKEQAKPHVSMTHMVRALGFVERCRESVHRAREIAAASETQNLQTRLLRQLGRHEPLGASLAELHRAMRSYSTSEIESALLELEKLEMVRSVYQKPSSKGGRPTTRWQLV